MKSLKIFTVMMFMMLGLTDIAQAIGKCSDWKDGKSCGRYKSCRWVKEKKSMRNWVGGKCESRPKKPAIPGKLNNMLASDMPCTFYTKEGGSIVSSPSLYNKNNVSNIGGNDGVNPNYITDVPNGATFVKVGPDLNDTGDGRTASLGNLAANTTYQITTDDNGFLVIKIG